LNLKGEGERREQREGKEEQGNEKKKTKKKKKKKKKRRAPYETGAQKIGEEKKPNVSVSLFF